MKIVFVKPESAADFEIPGVLLAISTSVLYKSKFALEHSISSSLTFCK